MIEVFHRVMLFKLAYCLESIVLILGGNVGSVHVYITYHHASFPVLLWITTSYYLGGQMILFLFINMLTHLIIYSFMFLRMFIPMIKKLNWHAIITFIDVVQMLAIFLCFLQLYVNNSCGYPMLMVHITSIYLASLLLVFFLSWPFFNRITFLKEVEAAYKL